MPSKHALTTRAVLWLVWPSILLQSARDRVATAAETVTAPRLWNPMSVNSVHNTIKRFLKCNWVTGVMFSDEHYNLPTLYMFITI